MSCKSKKSAVEGDNKGSNPETTIKPEPSKAEKSCIQLKIEEFSASEKKNPPVSIYQYYYKDEVVYYVSSYCCDVFSQVLDKDCKVICAPDGGITGEGDGKCKDFHATATKKTLIWKDER